MKCRVELMKSGSASQLAANGELGPTVLPEVAEITNGRIGLGWA